MTLVRHDGGAYGVACSPDGTLLVSSGWDGKLRITEIATGKQVAALHIGGHFNHTAAWSPDGQSVVGGCKTLSRWDVRARKSVASFKGHRHEVNAARFSPDGTRLASGSGENWTPTDYSVRIWDAASGAELRRFKLDAAVEALSWIDDTRLLALAGQTICAVDVERGEVTVRAPLEFASESMERCPVTGRVVVAMEYGAGAVVIGDTAAAVITLAVERPAGAQAFTRSVTVRPRGQGFVVGTTLRGSGPETCVCASFDADGKPVARAAWEGNFLQCVACSPDGELMFAANADGEVRGFHVRDGSPWVTAKVADASPTTTRASKPTTDEPKATTKASAASLLYGDVFGLTLVTLAPRPKAKTTSKVGAPGGRVSRNAELGIALVDGRVQTGAYADDGVVAINLPGLGVRAKLSGAKSPIALMPGAKERVVSLAGGELVVHDVEGDQMRPARALPLTGVRTIAAPAVGPSYDGPSIATPPHLAVHADGSFAALLGSVLIAGRLDLDGERDEAWWAARLALHPTATKSLAITEDAAWLTVMDHAAGTAAVLRVDRDGQTELQHVASLCPPAIGEHSLAFHPAPDRVVVRALRDGRETSYDVGPYNPHPHEAPEPTFYKGAPPPAPTRLVGALRLVDERAFFVPWHREYIVELSTGERIDRGLPRETGPFRRGMLEIFARDNASLAALQLEAQLGGFHSAPKYHQCPMQVSYPPCPATFAYGLAVSALGDIVQRFEMRTHGWGWGSLGRTGGPVSSTMGVAGLPETRDALAWMRRADVVPLDVASVHDAYTRLLGIPHEPDERARVFDSVSERVWLRAALETLHAGGWDGVEPSEQWEREPLPLELVERAVRARTARPQTNDAMHTLACLLARHLDRDALPGLLAIMEGHPSALWNRYRSGGELVVWLCHRHPDLRDRALAGLDAQQARGDWNPEKQQVRVALEQGKRHLWSNG